MDPSRIEQLRDPAIYPERPESVEILQTHLSVVALSGDHAYKFKKAIRLPFADFTSMEQRGRFCGEEVRLNRRLCPGIYEGVVELRCDGEGRLRIGGEGELVDYAVRMRRMPQDRMMDVLLGRNGVERGEVEAIARQVVDFHRGAGRGPEVAAAGDPEQLQDFALANFGETRGLFPGPLHRALEARTRRDFDRFLPLLKERAASGFVVDGHGDLHARNICLIDPPAIYDCIEFNPAFRCGDVATEHAFLAMDLRFRGHPELARAYLETVLAESGDPGMAEVLPMLIRYRAMVRAKVSAITSGESEIPADARAEAASLAVRYLRLAAATAVEEEGPWWLAFCGLPASGKSSVAEALRRSSGEAWPVLSSDRIRKELAGASPTETLPSEFYTPAFSRRTYDELRSRAATASDSSPVVILDANFREREERLLARNAARESGARFALLQVEAGEARVIERLARRKEDPRSVSDADRAVYEKLKAHFESPLESEADLLIHVPGEVDPDVATEGILAGLLG